MHRPIGGAFIRPFKCVSIILFAQFDLRLMPSSESEQCKALINIIYFSSSPYTVFDCNNNPFAFAWPVNKRQKYEHK